MLLPVFLAQRDRRRHCSFGRADIKRARKFRDDRHVLEKPAERVHAVDQRTWRFWMQKIERIDPNIAITYLLEQTPE